MYYLYNFKFIPYYLTLFLNHYFEVIIIVLLKK